MTTVPVSAVPDQKGRFGRFGGVYVPETLIAALHELSAVYQEAKGDPGFWSELESLLRTYVGRPTPLYFASRLTDLARERGGTGRGASL